MTVCVGVVVNDGLVFAADSASSIVQTDADGRSAIVNVYQHGDKVYNLHRKLPVVAMTCGMGNVGNESLSTLAKELRQRLTGRDPEWHVDPWNYTVHEIALKARKLLFERKYAALDPVPPNPHSLEFWVGGYPSGDHQEPEVWKITIVNGTRDEPMAQLQGSTGLFWGGQTTAIHRLVIGFDDRLSSVLADNGVPPDAALEAAQALRKDLEVYFALPTMPVIDAIGLADFLASTTKQYVRFLPGADVVGGETDIAVVTRYEGFKWIRRKHFYPAALNPREVDHA